MAEYINVDSGSFKPHPQTPNLLPSSLAPSYVTHQWLINRRVAGNHLYETIKYPRTDRDRSQRLNRFVAGAFDSVVMT